MSHVVPELELIELVRSFITKPRGTANAAERLACKEFCSIHDDIIRAMIRRVHKEPDIVDDLTQEVWLAVVGGLSNLRLDPALGSITAWIVKIAINVAKKHARIRSKQRAESLNLETVDEPAAHKPEPDVEFEWMESESELRQLIERFAASLPEHEQRVVVLYWLHERSLSIIAIDMMISEDAAWGMLRRVSLRLADYLRRKGYGLNWIKNPRSCRISRR